MSSLLFECPRSGKLICSGIETEVQTLRGLGWVSVEVRCDHCQGTHRLPVALGRLEPTYPLPSVAAPPLQAAGA